MSLIPDSHVGAGEVRDSNRVRIWLRDGDSAARPSLSDKRGAGIGPPLIRLWVQALFSPAESSASPRCYSVTTSFCCTAPAGVASWQK
jgi:hypothetical protein